MVRNGRHVFQRKVMRASSPSSSTSSLCTSADDAHRCTVRESSQFLDSEDVGTTWLLDSHRSRDRSGRDHERFKTDKLRRRNQCILFIGAVLIASVIVLIVGLTTISHKTLLVPPDPEHAELPSASELRTFKRAAVCADGAPCAEIGKQILEKNGSAVDAALASLICNGLVNMQSLGLGGGFMMTIYERFKNKMYVLNARDRAPIAAYSTMFKDKPANASSFGALAVAVPGELAGYIEAHRRFGKLKWSELFAPTFDICHEGYVLTQTQYNTLSYNRESIYKDPTLRELFVDPKTNEFVKVNSKIKPAKLCDTLQKIANDKNVFYRGEIGQRLVDDLRAQGGVITMQDLKEYNASWHEPVKTTLSNGVTLWAAGLPGSGAVLSFILNVLDGYGFTPADMRDFNTTVLTYHRMIETFKYAYALRANLNGEAHNMSEIIRNVTSKAFAREIREKISDERTWQDPQHYGSPIHAGVEDHGTAHISILAPNGDAVSVTSTINYYFGSGVVSRQTGILLNNAMDDFGIPSKVNYFGIPPNPNNYIAPRKQPLSSMVPSILVDKNNDVKMVVGGAGGTKITTAVSQIIAKILWMGETVKEAVDSARIHHQLIPSKLVYEYGVPKQVIDGLKQMGHITERYRNRGSVACVIMRENSTILANADFRRGGDVYGIN